MLADQQLITVRMSFGTRHMDWRDSYRDIGAGLLKCGATLKPSKCSHCKQKISLDKYKSCVNCGASE